MPHDLRPAWLLATSLGNIDWQHRISGKSVDDIWSIICVQVQICGAWLCSLIVPKPKPLCKKSLINNWLCNEDAVEDSEKICKELNDRVKSVFTTDGTIASTSRWDGKEDLESNEIVRRHKKATKGSWPDEVSPYVLMAYVETLDKPLQILLKKIWMKWSGKEQISYLSLRKKIEILCWATEQSHW